MRTGHDTERTARLVEEIRDERRSWDCVAVHRRRYAELPSSVTISLVAEHVRGKLTCPSNLTIVLIDNYPAPSLFETSLRYCGIHNYTRLRVSRDIAWRNSRKLFELKRYLDTHQRGTEYVLYCDSADVVIRDHPAKAIGYLEDERCDVLFSATNFAKDYWVIPQQKRWADNLARECGASHARYLNTGVFVGRVDALKQLLNRAVRYVTENDLSRSEYRRLRDNGTLLDVAPDAPRGVGSDQLIMRYLHPEFYPSIKIDYRERLAIRR